MKTRWFLTCLLFINYLYRITVYGGFYVVSYVLGLYVLNITVQFFQPLGLPDIDDDIEDDPQMNLPSTMKYLFAKKIKLTQNYDLVM